MSEGKKRLILLLLGVAILLPTSVLALLFLDPLVAMPICLILLAIFLSMMVGRRSRRRDYLTDLETRAAQRGENVSFDRPFRH